MADIRLTLNDRGWGAFKVYETTTEVGEMVIGIDKSELVVYHTQIIPEAEGKGYAKQLLDTMVIYARDHKLNVLPLCPYVLAQFRRHPDLYADIWNKQPA